MVEAGELVSLQAASTFPGDARRSIALTGGVQQRRDPCADLRERHRRCVFFFPVVFPITRTTKPEGKAFDGDANQASCELGSPPNPFHFCPARCIPQSDAPPSPREPIRKVPSRQE